jgi:hypothetical protein
MRKSVYGILSLHMLFLLGCSGGGSGSSSNTTVDVAELVENKDFYRVVASEDRYYKETFDGNGTLSQNIYFMDDSIDYNTTVSYSIDGTYIYITESDKALKCAVEDNNSSVIFKCSNSNASASAVLPTYRWFTLEDAKANPQ